MKIKSHFEKIFLASSLLLNLIFFAGLTYLSYLNFQYKSIERPIVLESHEMVGDSSYPPARKGYIPDFWRQVEFKESQTLYFVNKEKDIGFAYPEDLAIYESHETCGSNIYFIPQKRVDALDLDISKGFAIRIFNCAREDEIELTEVAGKLVGKSRVQLRDNYFVVDGLVYENTSNSGFFYEVVIPSSYYNVQYLEPIPHSKIIVSYESPEELAIAKKIIGTMVTNYSYDLEFLSGLGKEANKYQPDSGAFSGQKEYNFDKPAITMFAASEIMIEGDVSCGGGGKISGKHLRSQNPASGFNDSFGISDDPGAGCVGFSTSGSLCANAGTGQCNLYGIYLLPGIGTHMEIVYDRYENGKQYKGVFYDEDLAADVRAKDEEILTDFLKVLFTVKREY